MVITAPAAAGSREHARRRGLRRPTAVEAPKRRAFRIDDGDPADAAHALTGAGLYEYGRRAVVRKRLPGAAATEDKSWYFAFEPRRPGVPSMVGRGEELNPTHAMLQAIVWEKRFVQCVIDGEPFSAELSDPVRERIMPGETDVLRRRRRPDVTARAVRASDRRLNGRPLDVEIAVSGAGRSYERLHEITVAGRPCLELCAERDEALEHDPNVLEAHLRGGLLHGAFSGRWIVAPDGAKAQIKSVDEVRDLLEKQRLLAEDELAAASSELASARELERASTEAGGLKDDAEREAVASVAAERDALLALVEAEYGDDESTSLVWMIAARVVPSLRDPRLRTRALRLASIASEIRARFPKKRSGVMARIAAFDRALHGASSEAASRRAEAESLAAIAGASLRHAEARVRRVLAYRAMLDELAEAGASTLLFPPGTSLRATIAYEHRRRFGSGPR